MTTERITLETLAAMPDYKERIAAVVQAKQQIARAYAEGIKTLVRPFGQMAVGLGWFAYYLYYGSPGPLIDALGLGCIVELVGERILKNVLNRIAPVQVSK